MNILKKLILEHQKKIYKKIKAKYKIKKDEDNSHLGNHLIAFKKEYSVLDESSKNNIYSVWQYSDLEHYLLNAYFDLEIYF